MAHHLIKEHAVVHQHVVGAHPLPRLLPLDLPVDPPGWYPKVVSQRVAVLACACARKHAMPALYAHTSCAESTREREQHGSEQSGRRERERRGGERGGREREEGKRERRERDILSKEAFIETY
jgi:hypothetical protein